MNYLKRTAGRLLGITAGGMMTLLGLMGCDQFGESMAGCYEVNFSGSESGSSIERMEIKTASSGGFEVVSPDKSEKWGFHMKRATPEEVQFVSQRFRLDLRQGVSLKYDAKDPSTNQPPIGVYKGKDEKGNDVTLAFFFLANGIAKKVPCR